MATVFEAIPELDEAGRAEAERKLTKELDDSDMVFVVNPDGPGWLARGNKTLVVITPDYAHGTYHVASDLGLTIKPEREVATRAMANFLEVFRLKICEIYAQDPDGDDAWVAGARVFYGFDRMIGTETVERAVHRCFTTTADCAEDIGRVNDGRSLRDSDGDADRLAHLFRRL